MLGAAAIRLRLLDVPLDRDEGEYAYIGRLILDGVPPYARAYTMKMPGTAVIYAAALAVFGSTAAAAHLGLLVANALATVLVFVLAQRRLDAVTGVAAAAIFAVASLNPELHGLAAYAEHFVLPVALGGAVLVLAALGPGRGWPFAVAGLLFGLAFVIKQSGGFLLGLPVGAVLVELRRGRLSRGAATRALGLVLAGAVAPVAVVCAWLTLAGTFGSFWFWAFRYASEYATLQSPAAALRMFASAVGAALPSAWPILALAVAGLVVPARADRAARGFLGLFLVSSFVAASAGWYYRPQYFLLLLPALALLAAHGATATARALTAPGAARAAVGAALVALPVAWPLVHDASILFRAAPDAVSRAIYGRNPFVESVEVARYIRERSAQGDRIAVIGSEPQIYFHAGRPAATAHIYMYPLMEAQPYAARMQLDMIRELEAARPKYLVFVNLRASWLATPASDGTLARWFDRYWRDFERVGVADIVSRDLTRYRWDEAARDYTPESPIWLGVFRRRE